MKRRRFLMSAPAMMGSVVAVCPAHAATPPDSVVISFGIDNMGTMDPAIDVGAYQYFVRNLYDYLVGLDPNDLGKPVPELARSWDVDADGRTWTFRMDPSARFASGNPVTAHDAAWSFIRTVRMGRTGSSHASALGFTPDTIDKAFVAADDATLRITMPQAYAPAIVLGFLAQFNQCILDSKLVREREQSGDWGAGFLRTNSAGSGAFRVSQWRPNELIVLDRNERYWRGAPAMRRVLIRHMTEATAIQLALEKADIDLGLNPPADILRKVQSMSDLKAVVGPPGLVWHAAMNVGRKPFDNPRVRLAIKHLFNYEAIPRLLGPFGIAQQSFLQPSHVGFSGQAPFRLDLDRARALLAEAGLAQGFSCSMRSANSGIMPTIVEEFQQNAAKVGIQIKLNYEAGATLYPAWRNRDYDLIAGATDSTPESNVGATDFLYNTNNEDRSQNNRRAWRSGWQQPEAVRLVEAARTEMDATRRAALYGRLERIFFDEGPFVVLYSNRSAVSARRNVDGVDFRPELRLANVTKARS